MPVVLAREAGASVTDLDRSVQTLRSRPTFAAAPGLHEELFGLVRDAVEGSRYGPVTWPVAATELR
jgi:hypothetical protein